ncbi:MAG: SlyX family protein [Planctomycetota bacterium]
MSGNPTADDPRDDAAKRVELEHKLAFLQRAFDDLNSVVLEQQAALDSLRRDIGSLKQHLQRLEDQGGGNDLPHERPPHY